MVCRNSRLNYSIYFFTLKQADINFKYLFFEIQRALRVCWFQTIRHASILLFSALCVYVCVFGSHSISGFTHCLNIAAHENPRVAIKTESIRLVRTNLIHHLFYWPIHIYNKRISGIDSTASFHYDTLFAHATITTQRESKKIILYVGRAKENSPPLNEKKMKPGISRFAKPSSNAYEEENAIE